MCILASRCFRAVVSHPSSHAECAYLLCTASALFCCTFDNSLLVSSCFALFSQTVSQYCLSTPLVLFLCPAFRQFSHSFDRSSLLRNYFALIIDSCSALFLGAPQDFFFRIASARLSDILPLPRPVH